MCLLLTENTTRVAFYAQNSAQWFIAALACARHSMVIVPLYDTLGPDSAAYIISQTDAE